MDFFIEFAPEETVRGEIKPHGTLKYTASEIRLIAA